VAFLNGPTIVGVRSNSQRYGVELECFCNILHGSDGVWAQTGGKPVKSMWKEYTTSFRRVWLGNLYELVLCCATILTKCRSMNAMSAHRGGIIFFELSSSLSCILSVLEDVLNASSIHDLARYKGF
jgi:hypothetical protein